MNKELKMWIVVRTDIEMPIGKAMAQAGHAIQVTTMNAMLHDEPNHPFYKGENRLIQYLKQDMPKISVKAKNLAALDRAYNEAKESGIPCSYIVDHGRTVFAEPTPTVVGIGPCYYDELPKYIQRLQLL